MFLRLNGNTAIEDLRHHSAELVDKLRKLLATGAEAQPDPRRPHFYDVRNCTRTYFIHISPVSGKVMLLATWANEGEAAIAQVGMAACR